MGVLMRRIWHYRIFRYTHCLRTCNWVENEIFRFDRRDSEWCLRIYSLNFFLGSAVESGVYLSWVVRMLMRGTSHSFIHGSSNICLTPVFADTWQSTTALLVSLTNYSKLSASTNSIAKLISILSGGSVRLTSRNSLLGPKDPLIYLFWKGKG